MSETEQKPIEPAANEEAVEEAHQTAIAVEEQ
ncbi:MAG: hypothetical protein DFNUSKGM_002951, partial [Candidatus Fervidibacter sacchari]